MWGIIVYALMGVTGGSVVDYEARIRDLEEKVASLEKSVQMVEPIMEKRYGLIRRCEIPQIENGVAECEMDQEMKPGTICRLVCNPGYIATPQLDKAECKEGGVWSLEMKCEVPLVIVGGGLVNEDVSDVTLEVLDFEDRSQCKFDLPDLPLRNGSGWSLHNMIYHKDESELLACNGITEESVAVCYGWKMSPDREPWNFHSYANRGSNLEAAMDSLYSRGGEYLPRRSAYNPYRNYGRYAAESHTIDGDPVILGGMVYNSTHHLVTNSIRSFSLDKWSRHKQNEMLWNRAFFCSVKVNEAGVVNLGGYGDQDQVINNATIRRVTDEREFIQPIQQRELPNMPIGLSGHGCTLLPISSDIMVSGGSRNQKDNSQWSSYIYSWENNTWNRAENMNQARFGHKLVTVGSRVYALGGKERNGDVFLDSIEEFDISQGKWKTLERKLNKQRAHFGLALVPRSIFPGCGK